MCSKKSHVDHLHLHLMFLSEIYRNKQKYISIKSEPTNSDPTNSDPTNSDPTNSDPTNSDPTTIYSDPATA